MNIAEPWHREPLQNRQPAWKIRSPVYNTRLCPVKPQRSLQNSNSKHTPALRIVWRNKEDRLGSLAAATDHLDEFYSGKWRSSSFCFQGQLYVQGWFIVFASERCFALRKPVISMVAVSCYTNSASYRHSDFLIEVENVDLIRKAIFRYYYLLG